MTITNMFKNKRHAMLVALAAVQLTCTNLFAQTADRDTTNTSETTEITNIEHHHRNVPHRKKPFKLHPMPDDKFELFLSKVKKASFGDCKTSLVEVACISNHFACRQVLAVIKQFSFDSEKFKVIEIMSPYILDKENAEMLSEHFFANSDKKKVMSLLKNN